MKKLLTTISITAALAIGAQAADTQALTKATVKLIKENANIHRTLNDHEKRLTKNRGDIDSLLKTTTLIQSDSEKLHGEDKILDDKISANKSDIQNIKLDIESLKNSSKVALAVAKDSKKAYEDLQKLKEEIANVKTMSGETIPGRISNLEAMVAKIEKSLNEQKTKEANDYKELKELIKTNKMVVDAEIKIIKAKLDRAKPIVVNTLTDCPDEKCSIKVDKNDEEVLNDFLKDK